MKWAQFRFLTGIFMISAATLCFELSLIRYFSISQQYHFAFLVVSIAFLGYGASGSFLSLFDKILRIERHRFLSMSSLLFSLSIIFCFLLCNQLPFDTFKLSWDSHQILFILLFYLLLSIPFLFAGVTLSYALTKRSELVNKIYFSDLLGAGIGTLLTLVIFLPRGDKGVVPLISLLALLSSFLFSVKRSSLFKLALLLLMGAEMALFIHGPPLLNFRISPFKALPLALRYPGAQSLFTRWDAISRLDVLDSPAVRFAPGLSLRYDRSLPPQRGLAIDGGELTAVTAFQNAQDPSLNFLDSLPSSVAFSFFKKPCVLVIEPRGGLDVLAAYTHNASRIKVIESRPLVVKTLRNELALFSGQLYDKENIKIFISHSRAALKQDEEKYDLIILSLADVFGASGTGLYGFGEKYLYTVESFTDILSRLYPEGMATMTLYILPPPRQELRVLATWIAALEKTGKNPSLHLMAVRSWGTITMFVKNRPVSQEDIQKIKNHCQEYLFDLVYYPGIKAEEVNIHNEFERPLYYESVLQLLSSSSRKKYFKDYLFRINPVFDNSPFFYNFFKLSKIKSTYFILGQKWLPFLQGEYLIILLLTQSVFIAFLLILLPIILRRRERKAERSVYLKTFFYFSLIGMAFMFVEIIFIQKFILFLGHPLYSASAILFSLLFASSLGSYFSREILKQRLNDGLRVCLVLTSLLILSALVFYSRFYEKFMGMDFTFKILLTFLFIFPLGFLMGFPFPTGIRLLESIDKRLIPWAWATNAFSSVISSVLALFIAFWGGYNLVLGLAAAGYLISLLFSGLTRQGE